MLGRLLDSPLFGDLDGPVERDGHYLKGITSYLHLTYGGGHTVKETGASTIEIGTRVHSEVCALLKKREVSDPHPWTELVFTTLADNGLVALASEVPIAYHALGTRIDIVARRTLLFGKDCTKLILISLKTGSRRGPERTHRRRLPGPFSLLPRCEQTLDMIQITAERGMAWFGHGVAFDSAWVLEVPGCIMRKAPPWTEDREKQFLLLSKISS